jgi:hypothetical protein
LAERVGAGLEADDRDCRAADEPDFDCREAEDCGGDGLCGAALDGAADLDCEFERDGFKDRGCESGRAIEVLSGRDLTVTTCDGER